MGFKNIHEALKHINRQAKAYPSEIDYYSSEEYKKIYPDLCRVNRLLQAAYNVRHEDGSVPLT
jgi:asparagine synthetase A